MRAHYNCEMSLPENRCQWVHQQQLKENERAVYISWIETSRAERDLGKRVGAALHDQIDSEDALSRAIEDLGFRLATNKGARVAPEVSKAVNKITEEFAQLQNIDLSSPFPLHADHLTGNFFKSLAYEIGSRFNEPVAYGMVGTPSALAADMVEVAAIYWLANKLGRDPASLIPIVSGSEPVPTEDQQALSLLLQEGTWYDPCVGGGVFPLTILLFLARFGINPEGTALSNIEGGDVDPFAVAACKVRMTLAITHLTRKSYEHTWSTLAASFQVVDSLRRLSEQPELGETCGEKKLTKKDIVIGNPPYVRANRISRQGKGFLGIAFPSVAGGVVDLYNYFVAHGLLALKPGGVMTYISPASFQKSRYGKKTRQYIERVGAVKAVFDFDELPVFEDASIHTSVYVIGKGQTSEMVRSYEFEELPEKHPLLYGLARSKEIPPANIGTEGWHIHSPATKDILGLLSHETLPLKDYVGQIYSGIKTGYSRAYFLSQKEATQLQADAESRHLIKPLLRPVSIRAWKSEWDGTHIIYIKKGEVLPTGSAVLKHLLPYRDRLKARSDIQGHPTWYGLRECSYCAVFDSPKIIFPDIASECRFALDTEGYLIPDGAFMLPTDDLFLLGLLNSCVGCFYFRARCNSIGNPRNRGRLRFKKTYVRDFPVPRISKRTDPFRDEIASLAAAAAHSESDLDLGKIDLLALKLYKVPEIYWDVILQSK